MQPRRCPAIDEVAGWPRQPLALGLREGSVRPLPPGLAGPAAEVRGLLAAPSAAVPVVLVTPSGVASAR